MDSHSILPMYAKPSAARPAFTTMRACLSRTTLRVLLEKRLWGITLKRRQEETLHENAVSIIEAIWSHA
jgi:hypothetical protein